MDDKITRFFSKHPLVLAGVVLLGLLYGAIAVTGLLASHGSAQPGSKPSCPAALQRPANAQHAYGTDGRGDEQSHRETFRKDQRRASLLGWTRISQGHRVFVP